LLEDDGVLLARRKSGGGCVYQDKGNSVFGFINPINKIESEDFKTMNNDILLSALKDGFGIDAKASGRNDLVVSH
jgi:lipoate-protein ligase A